VLPDADPPGYEFPPLITHGNILGLMGVVAWNNAGKNLFVSYVESIKICDLLVIKIVLEHELAQLIQPITRIHLALDRFDIIDFVV
jgi:hypothetical protein